MTIAVRSNDSLSGLKGQNNPLQSPLRAGSNGDAAGARRKEAQVPEASARHRTRLLAIR